MSEEKENISKQENAIKGIEKKQEGVITGGAEIPEMAQKPFIPTDGREKGAEIPTLQPIKPQTSDSADPGSSDSNETSAGSSDNSNSQSND